MSQTNGKRAVGRHTQANRMMLFSLVLFVSLSFDFFSRLFIPLKNPPITTKFYHHAPLDRI